MSIFDRWPNFKPTEVLSNSGLQFYLVKDILLIQPHAMDKLQELRNKINKPVLVNYAGMTNRGYRDPEENKQVGGVSHSLHMQGIAFDVTIHGVSPQEVGELALEVGFMGIKAYDTFTHIDLRTTPSGNPWVWGDGS